MKTTIKDTIFYGHIDKKFYKEKRDLLNQTNYHSVKMAYTFSTFFFAALALIALFYPVVGYTLVAYTVLTVGSGILTLLVYFWLPKHLRYVRMFYLVFECVTFGAGIMAGTYFSPNDLAVQFFLLLIVLPLLCIDKPINSILVSMVASAVFVIASYYEKGNSTNFEIDVLNCMCCLAIGIVFIYFVRDMNLKNIQATILIQRQAELDGLTGILNKSSTEKMCEEYLKNSGKGQNCALFIMDIDNFKSVNDTLGHMQGDALLRRMGTILRGVFRESDVVGRVGGDEFMALMKDIHDESSITMKADRIREELSEVFTEEEIHQIGCSIGIATNFKQEISFQEMYKKADQALYQAKKRGKRCYVVYDEEI